METTKNPPTESGAKPENSEKEKRDWLSENVLIPIEDNYRLTMSQRTIDFWVEFFTGWTRREILSTFHHVIRDCQFPPSGADWIRLRVRNEDRLPEFLNETPEQTLERLSLNSTGWGKACIDITLWGLKTKDKITGHNRMPEAYDKLVAEARKWNRPEIEVQGFIDAKAETLLLRGARA